MKVDLKNTSGPTVPYGTLPRRPVWPLVVWIAVFAMWFAVLIWLAVYYPAR